MIFPAARRRSRWRRSSSWLHSWNEFLYARLLTTHQNTLPLQVFQAIDRGARQQMAAVAAVLVLPVALAVWVLQRRLRPGALAGAPEGLMRRALRPPRRRAPRHAAARDAAGAGADPGPLGGRHRSPSACRSPRRSRGRCASCWSASRRRAGRGCAWCRSARGDLPEKLRVEVGAGRPSIDLFAQDNVSLRWPRGRPAGRGPRRTSTLPDAVLPALDPPRFDGRQYFLPFRPNVQVTYVNRARFERAGVRPPRTVEELRAVARALKGSAAGTGKVTLSLDLGGSAAVTVAEWVVAFGGDPLVLNDAGSVAAFEFLAGAVARGPPRPREPGGEVRQPGGLPRRRDRVARPELAVHLDGVRRAGRPRPLHRLRGLAGPRARRPRHRRRRPRASRAA